MKTLMVCLSLAIGFVAGCVVNQSVQAPPRPLIPVVVSNVDPRIVPVIVTSGHGTGLYIAGDLVATAYHVIRDEPDVLVDGVQVEIVATDPEADLAILRVSSNLGYSFHIRSPEFAESAWANGFVRLTDGLDFVQTSGHISGVLSGTDGQALYDGGVHFGMSGGPVVGADGYVIGVVSHSPAMGMGPNVSFMVTSSADRLAEMLKGIE